MNLSLKLSKANLAEYYAEFLGTFFFMFILFVSPLILRGNEPLVIAFMFIVLNLTFGVFSKGHFNPIFTIADYLVVVFQAIKTKDASKVKAPSLKLLGYLLSQLIAGVLAFMLANRMSNMLTDFQLVVAGYDASATDMKAQLVSTTQYGTVFQTQFTSMAFFLEFFFSMALVLFYQLTANSSERKNAMPYVVGLAYFVFSVLAKDITGASFNPIRSAVAAIFVGDQNLTNLWLYLAAPVLGAIVASIITYIFTLLKPVAKKA